MNLLDTTDDRGRNPSVKLSAEQLETLVEMHRRFPDVADVEIEHLDAWALVYLLDNNDQVVHGFELDPEGIAHTRTYV